MDQKYIDALVEAAENVFAAMLRSPIETGHVSACESVAPKFDISAIIGLSGAIHGSVILSFPTATAERVVSVFVDEDLDHTHDDFADALGELANMVAGSAKANFGGGMVNISCPSVVIGQAHKVAVKRDFEHVMIPCTSDLGEFSMEMSMRAAESDAGNPDVSLGANAA